MEEIFYLKLSRIDAWLDYKNLIEDKPMVRLSGQYNFWFQHQKDADALNAKMGRVYDRICIYCESEVIPESEYVKP